VYSFQNRTKNQNNNEKKKLISMSGNENKKAFVDQYSLLSATMRQNMYKKQILMDERSEGAVR
jgi:hypothetical protein